MLFLLLSFCFISHFLSLHLVCAAVELVVISYNEYNKSIANVQEETTLERMELLRSLPLFKNLSPNELKRFIQTCKTITFNKDDTIMRAGEKATACYVILSGEACLTRGDVHSGGSTTGGVGGGVGTKRKDVHLRSAADALQVSLLGPGSYFGEELMFENQIFEYNVAANKKTDVLALTLRELTYACGNSKAKVERWARKLREWRLQRVSDLETSLRLANGAHPDDDMDGMDAGSPSLDSCSFHLFRETQRRREREEEGRPIRLRSWRPIH